MNECPEGMKGCGGSFISYLLIGAKLTGVRVCIQLSTSHYVLVLARLLFRRIIAKDDRRAAKIAPVM